MSCQKRSVALEAICTVSIVLAFLFMLATSCWAAPVINGTIVAGNQITITGTGFSGTPVTVGFDGMPVTIVTNSATQIVATLSKVPAPGSYRLVVKSGTVSTVAYVAISAAPNVVAQVAFTNQTVGIPLTTLVTPKSNALFRISGTVEGYSGCSPPIYGVCFYWTDDTGTDQGYISIDSGPIMAIGNLYLLTGVIRDLGGAPLSYEVFPYSVSCAYGLFFTVEQLQ